MLSRLWSIRVVAWKGVSNDYRNAVCGIKKRWQTTKPAVDKNLSYMYVPGKIPLLESTVGKVLETAAERWPNRECVISIDQKVRLTFSELLQRADKFAAGLKKIGLRKGDRIGLLGPNEIEWLVSFMGASRAGLIVAGINPNYKFDEINYCVRLIAAKAVVSPESYRDNYYAQMLIGVKKHFPTLEHIIIYSDHHVAGTRRFSDVETLANKRDVEVVKEEQIEISPHCGTNIQFTSGTTGNPKAALLPHRALVNNSKQVLARLNADGHKVCLNVPYFHAFGMIMGVIGPLFSGSTVVLENPTFNPVKSLEVIVGEKCSVTFGTPTMWINMIDVQMRTGMKIDCLYTGSTGGAPASPDLYKRIRQFLRLENIKSIYGLTESTAVVNQSLHDEPQELTDTTIGYISNHIELKVIDEKGNIVPFGTPGELCTRGYSTMIGYWGNEESTKKTITEDEWLKTGDQYILRKDGYGLIVGRLKDMLIRGGENIFPKEIEHFLETHPAINEVHAFGVYDKVYGEEICACIRLSHGAKLTADDVINYSKGKISRFKIPRYIVFLDNFPKTTSGKIQKFKLKEELEERGIVPKSPKN